LLDQLSQLVLIAVAQRLGVEVAGTAGDDRLGDLDHLARNLALRALDEIGWHQLVLGAQHRHHQPGAVRLDHRRPILVVDPNMAERDPAAAPHRQA
jgi:hypothetical protein